MSRMLVLDFDGTMTDAEVEGAPFRGGYLADIAALVDRPTEEIDQMAVRYEAEVASSPDRFGWVFGGRIVAPAVVDPYLRIMPVARRILDECGCFLVPVERDRLLDAILYKYNYTKTDLAFRQGAGPTLRALAGTATYVVTNSHTAPVQDKIRSLGREVDGGNDLQWLIDRVHGRARKYHLDDDFDAVPEALELPGLSRPVLLRRKLYHQVLATLLEGEGATWTDLTVVGDIFELDLALPLALGASVGLVVNEFTPDYERSFVDAHPRGVLITDLQEVPALIARRL
jgi:FMN phosphatase YigB (HAD superfamily)